MRGPATACARPAFDRLVRSLAELLRTVGELKARDIHFASLKERVDTSWTASELVFHVIGAIANFERRLISERTGGLGRRPQARQPFGAAACRSGEGDGAAPAGRGRHDPG